MRDRTYLYLISANLIFISYYLVVIYLINVGYIYSRLDGDPFNYFVMAKSLAETGSTNVSAVEEFGSIVYTKIPAYIRSPLFLIFKDLDTLLRAIQVLNIIILTIVVNIFWVYLRKTIPVTWPKSLTFLPFIYLCFNPWFTNVFLPLADTIYALFFFSSILIIKTIDVMIISLKRLILVMMMLAMFMWTAFLLKFTSASILAFMVIYFLQNKNKYNCKESPWAIIVKWSLVSGALLIIIFGLFANINLIKWYIGAGISYYNLSVQRAGQVFLESIANLLFSAVPAQIIPNYNSFYDYLGKYKMGLELSQITLNNSLFLIIGLAISAVIGAGIWRSKRIMGAEIGCLAVMLPVLMIATNSTARLLSVVQPFFWIFFLQGIIVNKPLLAEKSRKFIFVIIGLFIVIILATQYRYVRKVCNYLINGVRPVVMVAMMDKISVTYEASKKFIDSLPKERTRFVFIPNFRAKWYAISNIKYVSDKNIATKLKEGYDIYVVVDCTRRYCKDKIAEAHLILKELADSQAIGNSLVFSRENSEAKTFIYKLCFQ
ncbi:MAG: hypothetical protein ACYDIC_01290 [Desulfobaccales bacterium]